jgi:hypothetical protein
VCASKTTRIKALKIDEVRIFILPSFIPSFIGSLLVHQVRHVFVERDILLHHQYPVARLNERVMEDVQ